MLKKLVMFNSKLFHQRPQILQVCLYSKKSKVKECCKVKQQDPLSQYYKPLSYKIVTMDDMPVPCGSWKEHYTKRNNYYNKVLVFGIVSLIGSILILNETVFFNAFPPPYPFPEDESVDAPEEVVDNGKVENEDK